MTWGQALARCEALVLAGSGNWRLPNIKELSSLADDVSSWPAIDLAAFPHAVGRAYWSSTSYATLTEHAWEVDFSMGGDFIGLKTAWLYSRCVRGGKSNTAPIAADQTTSTSESNAKTIILSATDADGDPLTYSVVASPSHGALNGAPPELPYQPAQDYAGSDSFTFLANDGSLDSNLATVSITVTADAIRPTGSVSINNGTASTNTTAVTINISAIDTGGSGLDSMRFANSGSTATDWEPYQTTKTWTLSRSSGTKIVYVQFKDKAGNLSDADPIKPGAQSYQATIICDAVRPTGSMLINNGAASTDSMTVTLNLSANDIGGSGLDSMRFVNSGGTVSNWEPYQTTKSWTLTRGGGTKTVYAQFRDKAGNISDADSGKAGAQSYSDTIVFTGP